MITIYDQDCTENEDLEADLHAKNIFKYWEVEQNASLYVLSVQVLAYIQKEHLTTFQQIVEAQYRALEC